MKKIVLILIINFFIFDNLYSQKNVFSFVVGNNIAINSSIKLLSPKGIFTYNKNNNFGNELISQPSFNLGVNYEYNLNKKIGLLAGVNYSYTETELSFQNFYSLVDFGSLVEYGYLVNTIEIPLGVVYKISIKDNIEIKNYFALTFNSNILAEVAHHSVLRIKNAPNDTVKLFSTGMNDFPSGNSLGVRFGIGFAPIKKMRNWEIGAYINFQFKYTMVWSEEVEFVNLSKNTYEYHNAILKDKADYFNFHIKYRFLKF